MTSEKSPAIDWPLLKDIARYYHGKISFDKTLEIAAQYIRKEKEEREKNVQGGRPS